MEHGGMSIYTQFNQVEPAPTLFDPIRIGDIDAPNRIFMAPMTRARATRDHVPTPMMAEYYAQRASAGLIIAEATGICREALGWPCAPGLYSPDQIAGWRMVTDRVHQAGGRIFAQLWHMGRAAHPIFWGGKQPVSASQTRLDGDAHTYEGRLPYVEARALTTKEAKALTEEFAQAARNAMAAGFDGVQLHGGGGYLIEQFLCDGTNLRSDCYGGGIEERIRFLRETAEAVASEIGAGRTAVRLTPNAAVQDVEDSDRDALFTVAAAALSPLDLAFLELRELGRHGTYGSTTSLAVAPLIRRVYKGRLVLNSDYTRETGQHMLDTGVGDAISWGRPFIANPDLPRRLRDGLPLASGDDRSIWYSSGAEGYVDFPEADFRPG